MERTQFTFYESFLKAVSRIKKKTDRCDAYDAICNYAMYGVAPDLDKLPDSVAIAFELSKPNLDASRRKATSGRAGGRGKQNESKQEANGKQMESKPQANGKQNASKKEKENEIENEIENEKEDECPPKSPFSVVLASYANRVNPMPTETCRAELETFVRELGADVCLRAIDVAIDERKTSWSYIRGILRAKKEQGVRSLADWDRADEQRQAGKKGQKLPEVTQEQRNERAREDMERARRLLAEMTEGKT